MPVNRKTYQFNERKAIEILPGHCGRGTKGKVGAKKDTNSHYTLIKRKRLQKIDDEM